MKTWNCGRHRLPLGLRTYVMGIVNATPDSFSGDGVLASGSARHAVDHALRLIDEGADILDIGGESTRPGADKISPDEELNRVLPLIESLAARVSVPLSVDTTKAEVARSAVDAGATIINDISGGTFDPAMLDNVASLSCGYVLMHLRGTPQTMGWSEKITDDTENEPDGEPLIASTPLEREIRSYFARHIARAETAGIQRDRLCLDAGFGFGKSLEENLEIVRRGRELLPFDCATLSATSRKSTIGKLLDDAPAQERFFGTAATVALAIASGADIVRVHDVRAMSQVARVSDAICR